MVGAERLVDPESLITIKMAFGLFQAWNFMAYWVRFWGEGDKSLLNEVIWLLQPQMVLLHLTAVCFDFRKKKKGITFNPFEQEEVDSRNSKQARLAYSVTSAIRLTIRSRHGFNCAHRRSRKWALYFLWMIKAAIMCRKQEINTCNPFTCNWNCNHSPRLRERARSKGIQQLI